VLVAQDALAHEETSRSHAAVDTVMPPADAQARRLVSCRLRLPHRGHHSVSAEGPDGSEVGKHPVFQWSGATYGSGGCDSGGECATALCNGCTPYQRLIGPVTLAEMTLAVNTSAKTALAKECHGMSFHTTTSVAY
jgi:hypothetical protein